AVHRRETACGFDQRAETGSRRTGTGLSPPRDPEDHGARMMRVEHLRTESQPLERTRHEGLHDDIEVREHAQEQPPPFVRLQIERDEPLVAGVHLPPEWLSLGRALPQWIADVRL